MKQTKMCRGDQINELIVSLEIVCSVQSSAMDIRYETVSCDYIRFYYYTTTTPLTQMTGIQTVYQTPSLAPGASGELCPTAQVVL